MRQTGSRGGRLRKAAAAWLAMMVAMAQPVQAQEAAPPDWGPEAIEGTAEAAGETADAPDGPGEAIETAGAEGASQDGHGAGEAPASGNGAAGDAPQAARDGGAPLTAEGYISLPVPEEGHDLYFVLRQPAAGEWVAEGILPEDGTPYIKKHLDGTNVVYPPKAAEFPEGDARSGEYEIWGWAGAYYNSDAAGPDLGPSQGTDTMDPLAEEHSVVIFWPMWAVADRDYPFTFEDNGDGTATAHTDFSPGLKDPEIPYRVAHNWTWLTVTAVGPGGGNDAEEVTLPGTVRTIKSGAFRGAHLKKISIPEGVEEIEPYAFTDCSGLEEISLPSTLSRAGDGAFSCAWRLAYGGGQAHDGDVSYVEAQSPCMPSLEKITLADGCAGYRTVDGVLYDAAVKKLVLFPGGRASRYEVPLTVTELPAGALAGASVSSVSVHGGVESIPDAAFACCRDLSSAEIGDGVASIGSHAFYLDKMLEAIDLPDSVGSIGEWAFASDPGYGYSDKGKAVPFPDYEPLLGAARIPAGCSVGRGAFAGAPLRAIFYGGDAAQWKALKKTYKDPEQWPYEGGGEKPVWKKPASPWGWKKADVYTGAAAIPKAAAFAGTVLDPGALPMSGDGIASYALGEGSEKLVSLKGGAMKAKKSGLATVLALDASGSAVSSCQVCILPRLKGRNASLHSGSDSIGTRPWYRLGAFPGYPALNGTPHSAPLSMFLNAPSCLVSISASIEGSAVEERPEGDGNLYFGEKLQPGKAKLLLTAEPIGGQPAASAKAKAAVKNNSGNQQQEGADGEEGGEE